jgi:hypothetical protein
VERNGKSYLVDLATQTVREAGTDEAVAAPGEAPAGNTLVNILNSEEAIRFRRQLNVAADSVCRKCVCWLYLADDEIADQPANAAATAPNQALNARGLVPAPIL